MQDDVHQKDDVHRNTIDRIMRERLEAFEKMSAEIEKENQQWRYSKKGRECKSGILEAMASHMASLDRLDHPTNFSVL